MKTVPSPLKKNKRQITQVADFESLCDVTQEAQSTLNGRFRKHILDTFRRYKHDWDQEDLFNYAMMK